MPGERMTIIFMLRYSLTVAEEVPADSAIGAVILSALRRHMTVSSVMIGGIPLCFQYMRCPPSRDPAGAFLLHSA